MTMLEIIEDQDLVTTPQEPGDHDLYAHYVRKDDIIKATFDGVPVTAICGKVWVASKTPEGKTVCPECKDIYEDDQKMVDL